MSLSENALNWQKVLGSGLHISSVSGALGYLLCYLWYKSQNLYVNASWDPGVSHTLLGLLWPLPWPLDSDMKTCFPSITPILFDMIGIPNMVCGHTVDSWSVAYCFWVTVTLISGVSFREQSRKELWSGQCCQNPLHKFVQCKTHYLTGDFIR